MSTRPDPFQETLNGYADGLPPSLRTFVVHQYDRERATRIQTYMVEAFLRRCHTMSPAGALQHATRQYPDIYQKPATNVTVKEVRR